jgi:hypothetical protein
VYAVILTKVIQAQNCTNKVVIIVAVIFDVVVLRHTKRRLVLILELMIIWSSN